jgi:2-methylcitrate dehydratase PrpD
MKRFIAEELAEFALGLRFSDLPVDVVSQARRLTLDSIGVALAGSTMPWSQGFRRVALRLGGNPEAALCGFGDRVGAVPAALANGAVGHANDFDEYYAFGPLHPASCLWTSLALGESRGLSGADFLASLVLGYDITVRIAEAFFSGPLAERAFSKRGFQAQALCGVFGSCLQAGVVLGLSRQQLADAIGIAATFPGGTIEFLADGSDTKRLLPGKACAQGILAAYLAAEGVRGPHSALEGPKGFFAAYGDDVQLDQVTSGLGRSFAIRHSVIKPYPVMGGNTAAIDSLAALLRAHELTNERIRRVRVRTRSHFIAYSGSFFGDASERYRPTSRFSAEMSLPYALGCVLARGEVGFDSFEDAARNDPAIIAAAAKVEVVGDPQLDRQSRFESFTGSVVELETTDGHQLVERRDAPHGSPADPLTQAEIEAKFKANAARVLPSERIAMLADLVERLHTLSDIALLARAFQPAP